MSAQHRLDGRRHHGYLCADDHTPGFLTDINSVGTGRGLMVVSAFPLQTYVAIIVGGGAPDIQLSRTVQKLTAAMHQAHRQSGSYIEAIVQVARIDVDSGCGSGNRQRLVTYRTVCEFYGPLVAGVTVMQWNFIKTEDMSSGQ